MINVLIFNEFSHESNGKRYASLIRSIFTGALKAA